MLLAASHLAGGRVEGVEGSVKSLARHLKIYTDESVSALNRVLALHFDDEFLWFGGVDDDW